MGGAIMLNEDSCWVPECIYFEDYDNDFLRYEAELYSIFVNDFPPRFRNRPVRIREYPIEYGKEEAFFHITCQDYFKTHDRNPDFRRCERIRWCRSFIENYACSGYECFTCEGLKVWDEPVRSRTQTCILSEEYRYMVVLEKRNDYYQLITAYYIEYEHSMRKKLRNYEKYSS